MNDVLVSIALLREFNSLAKDLETYLICSKSLGVAEDIFNTSCLLNSKSTIILSNITQILSKSVSIPAQVLNISLEAGNMIVASDIFLK